MRVLIVTFEFVPFSGGIAVYTYALAKGLAASGCTVQVLAPRSPGCTAVDERSNFETVRMNVRHGSAEWTRFVPGVRYVNRQVRTFRPDVLVLTSDLAHGTGALIALRHRIPYVAVVHGSEIVKHFPPRSVKRYVQSVWLRAGYRRASAIVCVSRFVERLMVSAGFDAGNLHVIYNGVDETFIETPASPARVAALRERYGLHGKKVLLTIARLVSGKGHAHVIAALPQILARDPTVRYLIAGRGGHELRLRSAARDLGVGHAVVFAGEIPQEEKIDHIDLCDAYVLPSASAEDRVEGLGIALLEAAARGKPLVGARNGGIREIVDDGINGYLVDPACTEEVVERVVRVLESPSHARDLGLAGKQKITDGFLAGGMVHESKRQLENVLLRHTRKLPLDQLRIG